MFDRENLKIEETHVRVAKAHFTSQEIKDMLLRAVADKAGMKLPHGHNYAKAEVKFNLESCGAGGSGGGGSMPVAVQTNVTAEIVIEQDMRPRADEKMHG